MTADHATSREKIISRALAGGMHVGVLLLLIFGVSWQKRHSEPAAVVDLWSSLPPPKKAPAPPVEPQPAPAPAPKLVPKPPPPPKPEVKPLPKPDIALKDKLEKERKVKEQQELEKKKQAELERRKDDEAKKQKTQQQAEAKKKDDEQRKVEREQKAQEAEARKQAQEKQALADKLAKQAASAQAGEVDKYKRLIQDRIRRFIVEPPNLQGNPEVEVDVRLLPGGDVLESSLRIKRSSGNSAYDQAVERAILKASPLPLPPDPAMFNMFRELNLKIRPKE
ncbi:MAG: cell envelope integrity protein TolA [Pseudomonadota bacterium]